VAMTNPQRDIQIATVADIAALTALARKTYVDAFGHSMKPSDLVSHLERNLSEHCFSRYLETDQIHVAADGSDLVGFAQVGAATRQLYGDLVNKGDLALRRLYVREDLQGQGIGQRLLDRALPIDAICFLDVWEDNVRARKFYERNRFEVVSKRQFHVESGELTGFDLIMRRPLLED